MEVVVLKSVNFEWGPTKKLVSLVDAACNDLCMYL